MKVLVTGGTVFVSKYIAMYYVHKGYDVYVLNRNHRDQVKGVTLIEADRYDLNEVLRDISFDVVIDTAYNANDVQCLLDALGSYKEYILISSSAVYPEYTPQPSKEEGILGENIYWKTYGTDKIAAEDYLLKRNPNAYILRPPYLYGQMNNVYREAFVFDCAMMNRAFYLPKDGNMKLQFFHIDDLCVVIDAILKTKPTQHILNVGNKDVISIREWVALCYQIAGKEVTFQHVYEDIDQREYMSFYDYEYNLDVSKQYAMIKDTKPLIDGLKEAFMWYTQHQDEVNKKPYIEYIDKNLI